MNAAEILKRIEDHRGKEYDLNNRRDRIRFFSALDREAAKKDAIISNIKNVLNGQSTYDQKIYKTIVDSRKK